MGTFIRWDYKNRLIGASQSVSEWVILGSNLIPILGVLVLGWNVVSLLFIYWSESFIIGIYFLFKIGLSTRYMAFFFVPFFTVHYGMFMFGHLAFLTIFADSGNGAIARVMKDYSSAGFPEYWGHLGEGWYLARYSLVPLVISHGISFWQNFMKKGEYLEVRKSFTNLKDKKNQQAPGGLLFIMLGPYARIVLMHITILVAALPTMLMGSPWPALIILVLLKIMADWMTHRFIHKIQNDSEEKPHSWRDFFVACLIVMGMLVLFHFF